jgi:tRNA-specific 2-thiouridylase
VAVARAGEASKKFGSCCSPETVDDARAVARRLGIPYYLLNSEREFERAVIEPFARAYAAGRTPVPCVACNREVKFGSLAQRARAWDAAAVATGHYARITRDPEARRVLLWRGRDARKDQSDFLWPLTQAQLAAARFPVGDLTKDAVREKARALGLETADKPESQEICFVPDDDYRGFLRRRAPEAFAAGPIVNGQGTVLGRHQGLANYTVGQRRGLGLAAGRRLYVTALDPARNAVVVGTDDEGASRSSGGGREPDQRARADRPAGGGRKIRHTHEPAAATIEPWGRGSWSGSSGSGVRPRRANRSCSTRGIWWWAGASSGAPKSLDRVGGRGDTRIPFVPSFTIALGRRTHHDSRTRHHCAPARGGAVGGWPRKVEAASSTWTVDRHQPSTSCCCSSSWPSLLQAAARKMEERTQAIRKSLEEAQAARAEAQREREEHAGKLQAAYAEAQAIRAAALKDAAEEQRRLVEGARAEAGRLVESARNEMAQEVTRARQALRQEVVDLALSAAERLIRKSLRDEDHRRIVGTRSAGVTTRSTSPCDPENAPPGATQGPPRRGAHELGRGGSDQAREMEQVAAICAGDAAAHAMLTRPWIKPADRRARWRWRSRRRSARASSCRTSWASRPRRAGRPSAGSSRPTGRSWMPELGRAQAQVRTAVALTDAERTQLSGKLERALGKRILLEERVDATLLGGFIAQVGSLILDGSLDGQLARMRQRLARG